MKSTSRETSLLTGRYTRTIQQHLKGVGIGMTNSTAVYTCIKDKSHSSAEQRNLQIEANIKNTMLIVGFALCLNLIILSVTYM